MSANDSRKLHIKAIPAPGYEERFRTTSGWVGADGDYSLPLASDRVLWLYSDTFVGKVEDNRRRDCVMINNSAAVQLLDQDGHVDFYYGTKPDGSPRSLITPKSGPGYFWLFHGTLTGKGLYLFLLRVVSVDNGTGFPFKTVGMSLGHVTNPQDEPDKWKLTQRELDCCRFGEQGDRIFGSAVLKSGEFVYIYGISKGSMILARAGENELGDPKAWRFLSNGKWGNNADDYDLLCSGIATEYSVSYLPGIKQFAAIYTPFGISGQIAVRLAPKPEGPWGEQIIAYDCPDKAWHDKAYSYAAKAHPELSLSPNELIVTYATNSMHFPDLFDDARLYWPRFVRLIFENP